MPLTEQDPAYKYQVGEEVIVRIEPGAAVDVDTADLVAAALPDWAIAQIVTRETANGETRYRVAFRWMHDTYGCTVPETAIEGTA